MKAVNTLLITGMIASGVGNGNFADITKNTEYTLAKTISGEKNESKKSTIDIRDLPNIFKNSPEKLAKNALEKENFKIESIGRKEKIIDDVVFKISPTNDVFEFVRGANNISLDQSLVGQQLFTYDAMVREVFKKKKYKINVEKPNNDENIIKDIVFSYPGLSTEGVSKTVQNSPNFQQKNLEEQRKSFLIDYSFPLSGYMKIDGYDFNGNMMCSTHDVGKKTYIHTEGNKANFIFPVVIGKTPKDNTFRVIQSRSNIACAVRLEASK